MKSFVKAFYHPPSGPPCICPIDMRKYWVLVFAAWMKVECEKDYIYHICRCFITLIYACQCGVKNSIHEANISISVQVSVSVSVCISVRSQKQYTWGECHYISISIIVSAVWKSACLGRVLVYQFQYQYLCQCDLKSSMHAASISITDYQSQYQYVCRFSLKKIRLGWVSVYQYQCRYVCQCGPKRSLFGASVNKSLSVWPHKQFVWGEYQ